MSPSLAALPSVLLAAAGLFASPAAAYFRMNCGQVLTTQRADPYVLPRLRHTHANGVASGFFDFNQTYESTRKSTCTTCEASADLSNYWTPTLWYQAQNGSLHRVNQLGGAAVYYIQRTGYVWSPTPPPEPPRVKAFPAGFRMLAGDPFLRSFDENSKEQKAIKHTCLDYAGEATHHQEFPSKPCPNGVRTEVLFPSCWDGVNLDSDNHKSHMAYPDQVEDGNCPETHPVRLVTILVEVIWDTMAFHDMWWTPPGATQPFVLSNGDPTGYGHHGDFLNGWDVDVLQEALDSCNSDTGLMTDCPVLQLLSADDMFDCTVPPRVPESAGAMGEWLDKLPGCITVTAGPERASPPSECSDTKDILPPQSYLTPVPGWTALGCARDSWEARVLHEDHWSPGGMTPALCTAHCAERGFAYAGVAFGTECSCGSSVDTGRLAGEGGCGQRCEGDPSKWCGGGLRMAVYQSGGDNPAPETPEPAPEPEPEPVPEPEPESTPTQTQEPQPTETEVSTLGPFREHGKIC
ncbi:WSC-domain-containing protein [Auricularia subglabra TFB-10046 SS5]|nr:WSC-domain-containing protein [Auricularia subglabra TFB-10046 SS5]